MNRYFYDLHLHSCLSPCGDNDMTPFNLVNLAALNDLDVIALTDHNSAKNCPAAAKAAKACGIGFVPGMELCTAEDIHVVCLFAALDGAMEFDEWVHGKLPPIANDPTKLGEQRIMDEGDGITGYENTLLITGADISITEVLPLARRFGGTAFPAHIDRPAYSILSALGEIPPECAFVCAEATARADIASLKRAHPTLAAMPLLLSSDAHYLEDIHPRRAWLELEEPTPACLVAALDSGAVLFGRG